MKAAYARATIISGPEATYLARDGRPLSPLAVGTARRERRGCTVGRAFLIAVFMAVAGAVGFCSFRLLAERRLEMEQREGATSRATHGEGVTPVPSAAEATSHNSTSNESTNSEPTNSESTSAEPSNGSSSNADSAPTGPVIGRDQNPLVPSPQRRHDSQVFTPIPVDTGASTLHTPSTPGSYVQPIPATFRPMTEFGLHSGDAGNNYDGEVVPFAGQSAQSAGSTPANSSFSASSLPPLDSPLSGELLPYGWPFLPPSSPAISEDSVDYEVDAADSANAK